MPTYEYKREDGTVFEIQQSIKDDALTVCPSTGQKVRRVISGGGGVVYKGDGWYVTDYKNGDRKKEKEASGKTESAEPAPSKGETKATDTAPGNKAGDQTAAG